MTLSVELVFSCAFLQSVWCIFLALEGDCAALLHRVYKFCWMRSMPVREKKLYNWIQNVGGFGHCLPTAITVPSRQTAWAVTKHSVMGSCSYSCDYRMVWLQLTAELVPYKLWHLCWLLGWFCIKAASPRCKCWNIFALRNFFPIGLRVA